MVASVLYYCVCVGHVCTHTTTASPSVRAIALYTVVVPTSSILITIRVISDAEQREKCDKNDLLQVSRFQSSPP